MTLEEKVLAVEEVFEALDREIESLQKWSTLQCKFGCGKCCFKPDIEASPLEFLPFAYHLYKNGQAMEWFDRLRSTTPTLCLILNPTQSGAGLCTEYKHRGLICRLFGFSARTNKYGKKELVTCEIIKTEQQEKYLEARHKIEDEVVAVPLMYNYYLQLHGIDHDLAHKFYPINEAIKHALEAVLAYYAYRES